GRGCGLPVQTARAELTRVHALRQLPLGRRAGSIQANDMAALRSLAKNSAAALDSGRQGSEAGRRSSVAADRSGSEDTEGRRSQAFVAADIVAGGAIFPVGRAPVVPDRCLPDPEM